VRSVHFNYSLNRFTHAPSHPSIGGETHLWLPAARHRIVWSAVGAACTTSVVLSRDVRTLILLVLKVAWLYMVAGARG
jgi:hypothetical protein